MIRLFVNIWILLFFCGCEFQPLYHTPKIKSQKINLKIDSNAKDGYLPYKLRSEIESCMPRIAWIRDNPFDVKVTLNEDFQPLTYERDVTISRSQGQLRFKIEIFDKGKLIYSSSLSRSSSYAVTVNEEWATVMSQEGTRNRLITIVAQNIVQEIAIGLSH